MGPPLQGMYPLIRPSVRTGAPSPKGEGFGTAQIGRDSALCGTFGYIYWEFGWSAPVGRRAARVCRPYGGDVANPDGASRRPRPTKGAAGAQCESLHGEGAGTWPLIRPSVRTGAPVPIPSVPSGHLPLTRGVGPQGEGLGKTKRDRFLTCPLKHRGETQFRRKFLCLLSFSKKVGYTGPWRKRSIISWVREMAEPPWGRFSRSNQVPSPSSSSWRVTVSSSVSRSQ